MANLWLVQIRNNAIKVDIVEADETPKMYRNIRGSENIWTRSVRKAELDTVMSSYGSNKHGYADSRECAEKLITAMKDKVMREAEHNLKRANKQMQLAELLQQQKVIF